MRSSPLVLATLLVGLVGCSEAPEPKQLSQLQQTALTDRTGIDLVESLTTEVGPRLPGSDKDIEAVDWAMAKLQTLNFDKVYKEPVEVPVWKRGAARAKTISPYSQNLVITALGGSIGTPFEGIQGEIIRFDDIEALRNADAAMVAGKIVFIDAKTERHISGNGYGKSVPGRSIGAVEASKKGAKAIVIRSVGTSTHRFAHTGVMRYQDDVAKIPAAAMSSPDAQLLNSMLARNPKVEVDLNFEAHNLGYATSYNVIAEVTGTTKADEIVLIGAHLDSWDEGTGALDDGAGVGIVSAAGHLIGGLEQKPQRTVRVVLFAAEEIGLIGAKQYIKAHKDELVNHFIAAESDFGAGKIWQLQTRVHDDNLEAIAPLFDMLKPLGVGKGHNKARGGPDVSIMPKEGVQVASLSQNGTDYFDYHHTPDDTFDKINQDDFAQNVAVWTTFANFMANVDAPTVSLK
ncbi:M28 family peptidase [Paraferrimonas sp. SM1919]|uniref:M28 family peptidase n=1 Tax=Paraferrimonas sp. SM1919 TaxID=2662263 RepID=UPI0013D65944|nr:M28 family peptidase [Paraferrimonas sp. SM1919]